MWVPTLIEGPLPRPPPTHTHPPDALKYDLHVLLVNHGKKCPACAKAGSAKHRSAATSGVDCPLADLKPPPGKLRAAAAAGAKPRAKKGGGGVAAKAAAADEADAAAPAGKAGGSSKRRRVQQVKEEPAS